MFANDDPETGATRTFVVRTLVPGVVLLVLACALGAWILVRGNHPFAIDTFWNDALAGWSWSVMLGVARVTDQVGGGWVGVLGVPILVAVALLIARRPWFAVYFLVAEAVSAGAVQALKHLFGRARPEDIIVTSDYGSFPSGHVANAATIATVVIVLFPRVWTIVAGAAWVLLMALSRTYLHAHWLSDTLGGAATGAGAALVIAAAFAVPLVRAGAGRLPPPRGAG